MGFPVEEAELEEVTVFDRPMLFAECRIDPASIPKGLYMYEVRHTDSDWGEPCQIGKGVLVNFFGTLITSEPIRLDADGFVSVDAVRDWDYVSSDCSLRDYMAQNPPQKNKEPDRSR